MDDVLLVVFFFGFLFSLVTALRRQRESIRASLFYCFMMKLGQSSLKKWMPFCVWESCRVLFIAVVLCHSNVHPLPLLLVTIFFQIKISIGIWAHSGLFEPFPQIFNVTCRSFQLLLVYAVHAFSQDFTNRVRAVSSGEFMRIVDEDPLESPLRGR